MIQLKRFDVERRLALSRGREQICLCMVVRSIWILGKVLRISMAIQRVK